MEIWLWFAIGALAILTVALAIKIHLLHKAASKLETAFADRLRDDTNTLIDLSCGDRHMRSLAAALNRELALLREKRHRYAQGDMELKNAITNISHDLRTPLTAICGYLNLLEQSAPSPEALRQIGIIRNRTDMLNRLTEELFQYSVLLASEEGRKRESVSLNRELEECVAAFYVDLTQNGITPDIRLPETEVRRLLDRQALSRVLTNLLHNALKYSDGDLEIRLSESGEIVFANTASGLSEVQVGRLFDRFYTVESAQPSTGLGLFIAKTLTEQMGGSAQARYEDKKLSIRICFPDTQ
ncbi:MAG: HAMP domain-containing histidine kinase [Clostridium sp.]|nr:HAMP domain-containing histidine kinase [Acetatifactor muris]MCM1526421.1 HAMP domain-containing histidine kinase [Bacteroides sp.]MCM1563216.1 HAMP domain-containing histidine kinase [Clostridium sp.]